jgi:hypothetical protein
MGHGFQHLIRFIVKIFEISVVSGKRAFKPCERNELAIYQEGHIQSGLFPLPALLTSRDFRRR